MDSPLPEELKAISTYILRAKEVEEKDPIIAYYCRLYAVKLAVEKAPKSKDSQGFILKVMDQLEKDKLSLAGEEAIQNEMIGYAHVENFALAVFLNADNEDRSGLASKKTAKTFLASSTFLEVLRTFGDGELDADVAQKIKYAKFKVADLMKAFKEGRTPTSGPPIEPAPEIGTVDTPSMPIPDKAIPIYQATAPSEPINFKNIADSGAGDDEEDDGGYSEEDRKAIVAAGKYAKFAQSALLYDDVKTAIQNLELALSKLQPIKIIQDLQ